MNKKYVFLILGILLVLVGFAVCFLLLFLGLYGNTQATEPKTQSIAVSEDPVEYLKNSWHFSDGQWDRSSNTITAIRTYDLTYEDGKKIGGQVFTGDLAPETYLAQTLTIAADLTSRFPMENVTVVISFRSKDQMELFSVDSNGNISTCWGTEP